jgi:RND family efflux transporter MFP subunit
LLATLDATDFQLGQAAARAQLTAAQVDRDQQRLDFRRFEELHRQGFISGADLERRRAQLDAAEARHDSAAAQANVSGNQATYAMLAAPAAGVVTAIDAEVGQVVSAGQSVVRIAQSSEKEVVVALPESRLEQLRRIPDVKVSLWSSGTALRGRVREIAPLADAATRTYPARIALIEPPPEVALGMTATVRFEAPLPRPVITVPMQALLREGDTTYVWKLDGARTSVTRHAVQIASIAGNDLVIASGVQPGNVLVTAGVHQLKEGQKVRVLAEPSASLRATAPISSPPSPAEGVGKAVAPGTKR